MPADRGLRVDLVAANCTTSDMYDGHSTQVNDVDRRRHDSISPSASSCTLYDQADILRYTSLVRRSGTHCQMNSEIRRVMSTASNSSLKQSCSALTSVTSALEVIFNVKRSTNPRFTYLLTLKNSLTNLILRSVSGSS